MTGIIQNSIPLCNHIPIYRLLASLLVMLLLLAAAGCRRSVTDRELDRVDAVMETDPELADSMLDSISPSRGADRARHALYRLVATGKLTGAVDNDSLLTLVADRYCTPDAPATRDAMIANFYRGTAYYFKDSIPEASEYMHRSEYIGELIADTTYLHRIYATLANLYKNDFNSPLAVEYAGKALEAGRKISAIGDISDMIRLAGAYVSDNRDTLAWNLYDDILSRNTVREDTALMRSLYADYGVSRAQAGDYDNALRLLSVGVADNDASALTYAVYAWVLTLNGDHRNADRYLDFARLCGENENEGLWEYYTYLVYRHRGDDTKALEALDRSSDNASESLSHRLDQEVSAANLRLLKENNEHMRISSEMRLRLEKAWMVCGLLLTVILVSVILTLYHRNRQRLMFYSSHIDSMQRHLDEMSKSMARKKEAAVKEKRGNVETLTSMTVAMIRTLQIVHGELNVSQKHQSGCISDTLDEVHRTAARFFEGKEGPVLFSYINEMYDGLMDKIRSDRPRTASQTLRCIALEVIGFSYGEIAVLSKDSYNTVARRNHRLKEALLSDKGKNVALYASVFNKNT